MKAFVAALAIAASALIVLAIASPLGVLAIVPWMATLALAYRVASVAADLAQPAQ